MLLVIALLSTLDEWSKATAAFKRALDGGSEKQITEAVAAVALDNSERAVKFLVGHLGTNDTRAYWIIINGLGRVASRDAVDELVRQVLTVKLPVLRRDLMAAVQSNNTSFIDDGLARILDD